MELVRLEEKFGLFEERWRPKIVARLNGQEVKVVKIEGEFPWHSHADADEMFMGFRGRFRLEFRDRSVEVGPGELVVIPRGVEHRLAVPRDEVASPPCNHPPRFQPPVARKQRNSLFI